jgi:hypothetical protein
MLRTWACLALLTATAGLAHHSFDAEYDARKPITLKGKVTKVDWMNPHIYVHLDATDEKGVKAVWMCEGGNPNSLRRNGWKRDTVKEGDEIVVEGSRAKDGSNTCNARAIRLPDGTRVLAGSSGGDTAPPPQ